MNLCADCFRAIGISLKTPMKGMLIIDEKSIGKRNENDI